MKTSCRCYYRFHAHFTDTQTRQQVEDKRFTNYKQVFAEPPSCDELLEFYYRSSSIALIIIELGIVNISRPMFYLCVVSFHSSSRQQQHNNYLLFCFLIKMDV
jgi:hypothetical protein